MSLTPESLAADMRYRSPTVLAKLATAAFVPYVAGLAYMLWLLFRGIGYADIAIEGGEVPPDEFAAFLAAFDGLDYKIIACRVLGIVAFCFWTFRAAKNLIAFGAPGEAPGAAVGWYFVPIACLWKPYQALKQVWMNSDPAAASTEDGAPAPAHVPWFFPVWWLLWLVSLFLGRIIDVVVNENPASVDEWRSGMVFLVVVIVEDLLALIMMMTVMWSLTRRQDRRSIDPMPRATAV